MNNNFFEKNNKSDITTVVSAKTKFIRFISMLFIILYILSPVDFIPDIFLPYGLLDDVVSIFIFYLIARNTYRDNKDFFRKCIIYISIITGIVIFLIFWKFFPKSDIQHVHSLSNNNSSYGNFSS